MEPTASQHVLLMILSLAVLVLYMCRADRLIFARRARRPSGFARPRPVFGMRERGGETMLVDPDGRMTRVRRSGAGPRRR